MSSEFKKFYEFGKFRFDTQKLLLEYGGEEVQLPPKALETLKVLLEEKGETISRKNFLDKVWAETFVEDANLTVAVSVLRKTLANYEKDVIFIQTVPRRGYRFVGDARERTEILEQPIIVRRHAYEHLTVEETSSKTSSRVFIAIALFVLVIGATAFAVWIGRAESALSAQNINPASEAFQKGDALLQKRQVCESIPYFREAISMNEKFARAYSNLAAALAMCDFTTEANEAVARALALDPNSAEAHATDGFIKLFLHWDWDGAESALRRAITLDPNSAKAHHWLGVYLSIRGRFREAAGEIRRAIEIEPDTALYHADLCQISYFEFHFHRAISECQKAEQLDPNFLFTPRYLRDIYLMTGDEQKAWEYEAKDLLNAENSPELVKAVEEVFRREGFKGLYEGKIRNSLKQIENDNIDANKPVDFTLHLAENYARLGDRENTLYWLERSFNGERPAYPFAAAYIGVNPRFAFLRDEPRFQAVLKRLNLAD